MSVEVKQCDREAWAQWMAASCLGPDHAIIQQIRDGLEDNDGPNLLAAHRHQTEKAMRERCAEEADAYARGPIAQKVHGQNVAAAIRSIDTRGE